MTVVDLYTVQIVLKPADDTPTDFTFTRLAALMAEAEENLTDLLPAGYSARIRRWDHPDPDEGDPE